MKKKYLGGLALIVAGSAWLQAGTVTVETSTKNNQGNYYGFTLALGTETTALTDPGGILENLRGESVALDSVSILSRSGSNTFDDVKLAVYTFVSDGNVGDFVGLSDAVSFSPDTNSSFTFDGIDLTLGQRYQFLFVNSDATTTALTDLTAEGATLLNLYQTYATSWGISVTADQYSGSMLPNGWGTYKSSGLNSWESHRMPVTSITVSSAQIPEPATFGVLAGVGVLILAAAKRRRKKKVETEVSQA